MPTFPASAAALLTLALIGCSDSDSSKDPVHPDADAGVQPQPGVDAGSTDTRPDSGMPVASNCTATHVSLQVGTGVRQFIPVSNGDTVSLYRGPQGGYMIYISVRAQGLDPSNVDLCYTETFVDSGRQFGSGCWKVVLTNDLGGGVHERVGVWGQVDQKYWTIPGAIRGSDATVNVTATDKDGCKAQGGWTVHVSSDPGT